MAFIPLVSLGRVIGKFMLYFASRTRRGRGAGARQRDRGAGGLAIERTRAEEQARRSEERLRFALDAASMGTWDWDLAREPSVVRQPRADSRPAAGPFDGTFASYEREIHPDDRDRVLASAQRALERACRTTSNTASSRPDGTVRWCEGKGRVEYEGGPPVRMTGVCMMVTPPQGGGARAARRGRRRQPAQGRVPGHAVARAAHAAQRDPRLGRRCCKARRAAARARRQALDVIGRNARLQAQLIEDILDVSRIISGKLELERAPVDAGSCSTPPSAACCRRPTPSDRVVAASPTICRRTKAIRSGCTRCSATCCRTRSSSPPRADVIAVTCEATATVTLSRSRTPAPASRRVPAVCLRSLPPGRQPRDADTAASAWGWPSPATSSSSTAARSKRTAPVRAREQRFEFSCLERAQAINPRLSTVERRQPDNSSMSTTIVVVDDQPD